MSAWACPGDTAPAVLLIADDPRTAAFLDRVLARAGYRVELAADGAHGLVAAATRVHTIIILDLASPVLDNLAVVRRLRPASTPILLLSARDEVEYRVAALDAGADDCLAKPFALAELLARMRALVRGRALVADQATSTSRHGHLQYAELQLNLDTREVRQGNRPIALRRLAFELLAYFLRNPERVIGRPELLERVWGYPQLGDANVVDVTVSRLRRALEAGGEPRLIHTVRPIGYILRSRPADGAYPAAAQSSQG